MKGFHQRSSQYEQILKKNEQMFALLAITAALCPPALADLNETVLNLLQEKCAFQLLDMTRNKESMHELVSYTGFICISFNASITWPSAAWRCSVLAAIMPLPNITPLPNTSP